MIVVSDASPILNLSTVGQVDLLHRLYGQLFVPPAVEEELVRNGTKIDSDWTFVRSPQDRTAVDALQLLLDPGESEAIVLAKEYSADLLLIDERRGWKIATARSIQCTGLLGVLAEAKRN